MASTKPALMKRINAELQGLPDEELAEVLDFVGYLKHKRQREERLPDRPKRGSAEALMRHAGAWSFEPGELDEILADIEQMREIEK